MTFTRRRLTLALAATTVLAAHPALAAAAGLSPADQALVDRATAYLQGLTAAKGRFIQIDSRGQQSEGELWLERPGKARFAYDPPSGLVVVSDGSRVSMADPRLKTFNSVALSQTPLSLFLARNIRLDQGIRITSVNRMADGFTIVARDTAHRMAGQIALTFTDNPLQLVGWVATDVQNRATRIRLVGLQKTSGLDPALFVPHDPRRR